MTPPRPVPAHVRRRRLYVAVLTVTTLVYGGWQLAQPASPSAATQQLVSDPDPAPSHVSRPAQPVAVYAHTGVGQLVAATRNVPYLLYVPESAGRDVDVVDPTTGTVVGRYPTGLDPQHVVPSYDLTTLWSTDDLANTVTPFDPRTGTPKGPPVAVDDPYNMYFLPGGKLAMVVQEQLQRLGFYDAQTMAPVSTTEVSCAGVDHADFTADEKTLVASCEFSHKLLRLDVATRKVTGYLTIPGSAPQDVRLTPDGRSFLVADKKLGGVTIIDARSFTRTGFLPTGPDAHGIYPSRDGRQMYVSNRGNGTITVIDPRAMRVVTTWHIPGGGSPDMGGVSPDGTSLWLTGRYDATLYELSTKNGRLIRTVHVPLKPHGMCVWPQPGRYSLGHTGNMR